VPFALQLVLQLEVVLDDAVVDDDDLAGAIAVRVGVLLRRPAVRRPAGVADAELAGDRLGADGVLEARELAGAPPHVNRAVAHDGHAGRVVTAVLEATQPVDEDGHHGFRADVADDAAHVRYLES